jgi:hypothetical protein
MNNESSFFGEAYQIDSVKPSEAPAGMQGPDWHCYVIAQGSNSIRGYRQGSRPVVMDAVALIVNQLNERRFGKRWKASRDEQPTKVADSTREGLEESDSES